MAPTERETTVTVRMSHEERSMLEALADEQGLTASDILRLLTRAAYKEKFGEKRPKKH
jgi:antitoxin component of RelBE/YafQ-DinJ toxin-antitoxin module